MRSAATLAAQRVHVDPDSITAADVEVLQRAIGNRATRRLLGPVLQRQGLTRSPAGGEHEQGGTPAKGTRHPRLQRDGPEDEELLQAKPLADVLTPMQKPFGGRRSSFVQDEGEGGAVEQPIPGLRRQRKSGFGVDAGNVRVHSGSQEERLDRSPYTKAFTVGKEAFSTAGGSNPGSAVGKKPLAHGLWSYSASS